MKTIKDMLSRVALFCRLESAIVSELEEINKRLYKLEANREIKDAELKRHTTQLQNHDIMLRKLNTPGI